MDNISSLPKLIQEIDNKMSKSNLHFASIVAHDRDKYVMELIYVQPLSYFEYISEEKHPTKLENFVVDSKDARDAFEYIQKNLNLVKEQNQDKEIILVRIDDEFSGAFVDSFHIFFKKGTMERAIIIDKLEKEFTPQKRLEIFDHFSKDAIKRLSIEAGQFSHGRNILAISLTRDLGFHVPNIATVQWIEGHKIESFQCQENYFESGLFVGLDIDLEYKYSQNEMTIRFSDPVTSDPVLLLGEEALKLIDYDGTAISLVKPSSNGTYTINAKNTRYRP